MTSPTTPTALCTATTFDDEALPGLCASALTAPLDARAGMRQRLQRRGRARAGLCRALKALPTARVAFGGTNGPSRRASGGL